MKLLPTIFRDPATSLAVTIMIVSLGTGSFVQQAIQTQSCQFPVDSAHASLPISQNITSFKSGDIYVSGQLGLSNLVAALSYALAPDSEEIGSPISVGCPTGNCTFENSISGVYSTLGMCSSCVDTSSLIKNTEWTSKCDSSGDFEDLLCITSTANYSLPNGMTLQASFGEHDSPHLQRTKLLASSELGLDWAGDLVGPDMKALSQWAIADVTILAPNWLPTSTGYSDYVAVACTLYPCLRSYSGSVKSGKLDEVLLSTNPAVPDIRTRFEIPTEAAAEGLELPGVDSDAYFWQLLAVQSPCLVNDTVWTKENKSSTLNLQRLLLAHAEPDPSGARRFRLENMTAPAECIYGLETAAVYELAGAADLFNGSCDVSGLRMSSPENGTRIDCGERYWLASFFADDGPTAASIIRRVENFTDRLSNKLRMGLLNDPELVFGQVLQATVCSRIHYGWLSFPAVLVAVTSGLLAWTMFQSSRRRGREMVWKTSILPFLLYGDRFVVHNGEDVSTYSNESSRRDERVEESLLDLGQMEAEAKQRRVRFDVF